LETIDEKRVEFHVPGRVLHAPKFSTPSGKAQFKVHPLPLLRGDNYQLRLMTVRSEGQFNTVVYEEEDIYRGQDRRDVILMNRADIERMGPYVDECVSVRSATGVMHNILVREFDIRAGNALMYFPEANVLKSTATDPASRAQGFKSVVVAVEANPVAVSQGPGGRVALEVIGSG
jgi:anaerobic selenocysteine-containing dehydrogenase